MSNYTVTVYKDINEVVYKKVLDNGLTILINKKNGFNKIFSSFITNFGASDTKFVPIGEKEFIDVPLGVAHFLEHKLFEMPDGIDASNLFADLGADSNAYTDYNETAYVVSCTSNFYKVIEILLDFVQTPYFTDENVDKEKGIIIEELKMYQDNPSDRLYNSILRNMYKKNNHREDVVGTVDSINSITKEILYTCYNTFYHPKNMIISISGDVDVEKTFDLIEENQKKKTFPKFTNIKCKYDIETNKVYRRTGSSSMDIVMPRVSVGIKLPTFEYEKDELLKIECLVKIMLEYKFGFSSDNYQYMLDEELISGFTYSFNFDKTTSHIRFIANSFSPKQFAQFIKNEVLKLKNFDIDEENFNRIKKGLIGTFIRSFDSVEFISTSMVEYLFKNTDLFNALNVINSLTLDDLHNFSKYFIEDSITYYIIKPKNIIE